MRYLPLAGMLLIVLIAACLRPWLHLRRYGTSGILLFRSGKWRQHLREALLLALVGLLVGQAALAAGRRNGLGVLVDTHGPIYAALQPGGAVLLFAGILLVTAAQLNMGASWRIGIGEGEAPGLVSGGLYRFCRHPIYLGMLVALTGYTALLPTPLSLALLAAAYASARMQAAAEEAYLARTYGEAFRAYARRVGRFLPGVGKMPDPPSLRV